MDARIPNLPSASNHEVPNIAGKSTGESVILHADQTIRGTVHPIFRDNSGSLGQPIEWLSARQVVRDCGKL